VEIKDGTSANLPIILPPSPMYAAALAPGGVMKKAVVLLFAVVAMALVLSGSAFAQGDGTVYFVTYYANNGSGAPDATVRFINDGDTGGTLYAAIYVFDDSQELAECGACPITPDGLLSEDVRTELTSNPVTGKIPSRGVIKVISSSSSNPAAVAPTPGLRGWATHIQRATPTSGAYATTEAPFADSNLSSGEESLLGGLCYYATLIGGSGLGSGQGTITCTVEDHDF
jgi:hypothetical protein